MTSPLREKLINHAISDLGSIGRPNFSPTGPITAVLKLIPDIFGPLKENRNTPLGGRNHEKYPQDLEAPRQFVN